MKNKENIEIKSLHKLDNYVVDPNEDQPITCPKCGSRTDFIELADDKQQHQCLSCKYEFFLDVEG